LESFSPEELIKLVRKQMGMLNQNDETIKQLEAAKKEAGEKLLASRHKVEEITEEMAKLNEKYQKLLEVCFG
jgi:hypothetical protein